MSKFESAQKRFTKQVKMSKKKKQFVVVIQNCSILAVKFIYFKIYMYSFSQSYGGSLRPFCIHKGVSNKSDSFAGTNSINRIL